MARDGDLSLAVLQGVGPSPVQLYQPAVLGRWLPLHILGVVQYSEINTVLDESQKDLRTMKNNGIAVFAASLQWADAVKVVSRGTPRSRTPMTWGIRWSVSAAEKDGGSQR